jgi:energy-coupling factor transporter ATP-binding protein EcfA2
MFTGIQALRFRSLRLVDQPLGAFRALVGPNGSGKTTFLDVVAMLGDLTRNRGDVLETLQKRSATFEKLLWMGKGTSFQLAVEAEIPASVKKALAQDKQQFTRIRYQVEIGLEPGSNEVGLDQETLWLTETPTETEVQRELFPAPPGSVPAELPQPKAKRKVSLKKTAGGNDNYYTEGKPSYNPSFRLGRRKSALGNLPADTESFPASTWFRDLLERGVQTLRKQLTEWFPQ